MTAKLTAAGSVIPEHARHTDRFRFAQVQAAYGTQDWPTFFRLCDCSTENLWPALGWYGGGTGVILEWYEAAILAREEAEHKRPLTQLEKNAAFRANPLPFCIRAVGH